MRRRKRTVVTGGAGFIGSHLCERLLAEDHEILCVDNFYTGSRENIAGLSSSWSFEAIRHDVTFPLYVEADQIYNLACPASPIHYRNDPVQTIKTSVHGAINVLGLAKRIRAPVLQASTSEIYGDSDVHPQTEGYRGNVNPIGPRACYNESKRCAETLFFDYRRQHGLTVKVVRIFNTYGPRMSVDDGRVVSAFVVRALRNEPITIHGSGEQTRSFCYVDDLVEGLVKMMDTPADVTGPINLGNTEEIAIRDLADTVIRLTGSKSSIVHARAPEDDPRRRRPDVTRAADVLNWAPATPLESGLGRTIDYFDRLLARTSRPGGAGRPS